MKKLLLLFLLATLPARADLVIVEELMSAGKVESRITTTLRDHKARIDYSDRQSAIFDLKSGEYIALIHDHKLYSRIAGRVNLAQLAQAEAANPLPTAKAGGKKETIDGMECEILTYKSAGASVRLWIAKEHPLYAKWKKPLATLRHMNREPAVEGMILKSETRGRFSKESTRVVSIREMKVTDSVFIVPAGYQKQDP